MITEEAQDNSLRRVNIGRASPERRSSSPYRKHSRSQHTAGARETGENSPRHGRSRLGSPLRSHSPHSGHVPHHSHRHADEGLDRRKSDSPVRSSVKRDRPFQGDEHQESGPRSRDFVDSKASPSRGYEGAHSPRSFDRIQATQSRLSSLRGSPSRFSGENLARRASLAPKAEQLPKETHHLSRLAKVEKPQGAAESEVQAPLPALLDVIEDTAPGSPAFSDLGIAPGSPAPSNTGGDTCKEDDDRTSAMPMALAPDGQRLPLPPRPEDPTLDFFSMQFDAMKALITHDLRRPNMMVASLNNLAQCRFILPPEMKESLAHLQTPSKKTKEEIEEQRARSGPARVRRLREELKSSAVERIAQSLTRGPLLFLKQCYFVGARIKVTTKHSRGMRGSCTGLLKAFDKHMNLILQDVEENYTVRLRVMRSKLVHCASIENAQDEAKMDVEGLSEGLLNVQLVEKTRTGFKQEHRSRRLKQIFVRGNNIITIGSCNQAITPLSQ